MKESCGNRCGGLPSEKIFRATSSSTSENASFKNRIWLVLIIENLSGQGKMIPQTDFIEFCKLRTRKGKAPPSSPLLSNAYTSRPKLKR